MKGRFIALASVLAMLAGRVMAQGPLTTAFTYQGELRQSGAPATGTYDLRFRLYSAPTGGTQLGPTLCADNIAVSAGRFAASLDFGPLFTGQQTFLEIDVRQDTGLDCSSVTGFTTLAPRQLITAGPNSLYALAAATAGSAGTATNASQFNGQAPSFYQNAANLTSGTIPSARLSGSYTSSLTLSNTSNSFSGSGAGLTSLNASNLSAGAVSDSLLSPNIPRLNAANAFSAGATFLGNVGIGTATPGMTLTVAGDMEMGTGSGDYHRFRIGGGNSNGFIYGSYPAFGDGVHFGYNYYADAAGVGHLIHTDGATSRIGVGYGTIALCTGAVGQAPSTRLYVDPSGNIGVGTISPNARLTVSGGTVSINSSTVGATTVFANAASAQTIGVYGRGAAYAVYGAGLGTYAVYGVANIGSYGVYADGNLGSNGTKSFRIDHPADPENKYLLHYCAESPEVINFYRGAVTLDAAGAATITLPSYFAAINTNPSYQLTAIGSAMPALHVEQEIDAGAIAAGNAIEPGQAIPTCTFTIAGGAPGGKVSWRVEAVRNDRYIQRSGAPVEQDKPEAERGKYQKPELYGKPAEAAATFNPAIDEAIRAQQ